MMQDNKLIKALVLNAQLGNNSAYQQLYEMSIEYIFTLLLRILGDEARAEKLSKKTYVNAWQKISEKDENLTVMKWFKRIAIETCVADLSDDINSSKENYCEDEKSHEVIEKYLSNSPLEKYIQDLDIKSRVILILRDIENFSYAEISVLLNLQDIEVMDSQLKSREKLISMLE